MNNHCSEQSEIEYGTNRREMFKSETRASNIHRLPRLVSCARVVYQNLYKAGGIFEPTRYFARKYEEKAPDEIERCCRP